MLTLPITEDDVAGAAEKLRNAPPSRTYLRTANLATATFAGGCFWTLEAAFAALPGVLDTTVGYSGGSLENPTFRDICAGDTGHAEVVRLTYDPLVTTYGELLERFWRIHDPTSANRQGYDVGPQYRSRIFAHTREQERAAIGSRERLVAAGAYRKRIITEIEPAARFFRAEEYHQHYFARERLRAYAS